MKENIPGFSFMGFDRKPNKKISVQHVVDRRNFENAEEEMDHHTAEVMDHLDLRRDRKKSEIMEEELDCVEESGKDTNRSEFLEDFSITDSTTSKFEVIEKMLLQKVKMEDESHENYQKVVEKPILTKDGSNTISLWLVRCKVASDNAKSTVLASKLTVTPSVVPSIKASKKGKVNSS